jgi:hypothetical protein
MMGIIALLRLSLGHDGSLRLSLIIGAESKLLRLGDSIELESMPYRYTAVVSHLP